jgi:hypothetical protein
VTTLKDIGIWGPRIRSAFENTSVLQLADNNVEDLIQSDEDVAVEFEKLRALRAAEVERTVALGLNSAP